MVLFSVIIALLLIEISARVVYPDFSDDSIYLDHTFSRLLNSNVIFDPNSDNFSRKFGFRNAANSERTYTSNEYKFISKSNSIGFRTKEMQPKKDDEYRVLLVGDSILWGYGVDESDMISSVMEALGKSKLSVYNYSVSGYNTVQELIVAKTYLDVLEPDHMILGFFIANDIIPNAIAFIDEEGNYNTSAEMIRKIKSELRNSFGVFFRSTIFRVIAYRVYVPRVRYKIAIRDDVITKSYALLTELDSLAKKNDVLFSVVIIYPRDSVQGGMIEAWSNSREAGKLINSFCLTNSIEALNLIKYMDSAEHKNKYFFENDGHFNKEGSFVITKAIFNDLVKPHMIQ